MIGDRRKNNAQLLQREWDSAQKKIKEFKDRVGQLETDLAAEQQKAENFATKLTEVNKHNTQLQAHAQWLQAEWDAAKQHIEEVGKRTVQLETDLAAEQQKAENFATKLTEVNKHNTQLQAHAQWLQEEWDAGKQRIEELGKRTEQLEAELKSERHKSQKLTSDLGAADDKYIQSQAHSQWLQNQWDADKQRIEELSNRTGQFETNLRSERQKSENLTDELNAATEHNVQLQAHAQWLQSELDTANTKVHELNHSSHHWWTVADGLVQERKTLYASRSWRVTKPLRLLSLAVRKIINGILIIPKGLWYAFKFPFKWMLAGLIRFIVKHPKLRARTIAKLSKYPRLQAHLRHFASIRGIVSEATVSKYNVDQNISTAQSGVDADLSHITPSARRIYQDLKVAIEQQQKENH